MRWFQVAAQLDGGFRDVPARPGIGEQRVELLLVHRAGRALPNRRHRRVSIARSPARPATSPSGPAVTAQHAAVCASHPCRQRSIIACASSSAMANMCHRWTSGSA
jgi:hypothetical protein